VILHLFLLLPISPELVLCIASRVALLMNQGNAHQVLAPLPIGFAVFMVHLATIPITGTGINPARSLGAAVVYNNSKAWSDQVFSYLHTLSTIAALTHLLVANLLLLHAVDLLGGPVHRRGDRSAIPPDRPPRQRQGVRLLPEQRLGPSPSGLFSSSSSAV
jgi:hypothetical protein